MLCIGEKMNGVRGTMNVDCSGNELNFGKAQGEAAYPEPYRVRNMK